MPCDGMLDPGQTVTQRKEQLRKARVEVDRMIASRQVQVKVGRQGAVTFVGIPDNVRAKMTDACIYRYISRSGSVAAKLALSRAEQMAGRAVDRKVVSQGIHSHDGGATWHPRG